MRRNPFFSFKTALLEWGRSLRNTDTVSRMVSGGVFLLALLVLLCLLLIPIANYYEGEDTQKASYSRVERAEAQLSRTQHSAHIAHTDSLFYLTGQEIPARSACGSTRSCLEESLRRLARETRDD